MFSISVIVSECRLFNHSLSSHLSDISQSFRPASSSFFISLALLFQSLLLWTFSISHLYLCSLLPLCFTWLPLLHTHSLHLTGVSSTLLFCFISFYFILFVADNLNKIFLHALLASSLCALWHMCVPGGAWGLMENPSRPQECLGATCVRFPAAPCQPTDSVLSLTAHVRPGSRGRQGTHMAGSALDSHTAERSEEC